MKKRKSVFRSIFFTGVGTAGSRLSGYLRDISLSIVLGAGLEMDIFTVVYRMINFFRIFMASSAAGSSFIPILIHFQHSHTREERDYFLSSFFYGLFFILFFVVLILIASSPLLIRALAPGLNLDREEFRLAVFLSRLILPALIFICLADFLSWVLNSARAFVITAAAPVIFNLTIIAAAFLFSSGFQSRANGVCIGVLFGSLFQYILQAWFVRRRGVIIRPAFNIFHPQIAEFLGLYLPLLAGIGMVQANKLVESFFASFLGKGSISSIYFSERIIEFILGVFVVSFSTVTMTEFSHASREKDYKHCSVMLESVIRIVLFVTIPAACFIVVFSRQIIFTLFYYGKFTRFDAERTAAVLLFFGLSLVFIPVARMVKTVFYSFKDTKTPLKAAVFELLLNIFFSMLFMRHIGIRGIALAFSLSSLANLIFLLISLRISLFKITYRKILPSLASIALSSFFMCAAGYCLVNFLGFTAEGAFVNRALMMIMLAGSSIAVYIASAYFLKMKELTEIRVYLRKPHALPS